MKVMYNTATVHSQFLHTCVLQAGMVKMPDVEGRLDVAVIFQALVIQVARHFIHGAPYSLSLLLALDGHCGASLWREEVPRDLHGETPILDKVSIIGSRIQYLTMRKNGADYVPHHHIYIYA